MGFPLSPSPAYYTHITGATRNNTWYVGGTPTFTLSQAGASVWTVRNYLGAVVATGSVSGTSLTLTGTWNPGWYRLYLTGGSTDTVFGPSYGATNFQILRVDARFPTMPARATDGGTNNGAPLDQVLRGVCGLGPQRYAITLDASYTTHITEIQAGVAIDATYYTTADTARPRELLLSFPNGAVDYISIPRSTDGAALGHVYVKAGVDPTLVGVSSGPGTSSGSKVQIWYPNLSTLVETYDNIASFDGPDNSAGMATFAASAYVQVFGQGRALNAGVMAATAIGNTLATRLTATVTALYPSVTWFEGPSNEPTYDVHEQVVSMTQFRASVKAGNAAAKVLGPQHVSEGNGQPIGNFLAAGGGATLDGISFHAYNMELGDLNLGRQHLDALAATLAANGQSAKQIWQTEQGTFTPVYGIYHPRRARWQMLQTLLQEQYGIRREQNHMWYDVSHGFWSQPAWWENSDQSVNPQVTMMRVLNEETYGKAWEAKLTFSDPGDRIYLGSTYLAGDGTRTVALIAASALSNGNVTLKLSGTLPANVTVVDAFGNTSSATVNSGGIVSVPVDAEPVYVRIPSGVTVTVWSFGDWPKKGGVGFGAHLPLVYAATATTSGAASNGSITAGSDGSWFPTGLYGYGGADLRLTESPPSWFQLTWPRALRFDRVVIWSGFCWQAHSTLLDFDVQTSTNGTVWTTQKTVNNTADAVSFPFGTDDQNVGCSAETFWREQWIFDLKLPAPVTAQYVRLYVRTTSLGGEPDAAALTAGGQGDAAQHLVLEELAVYSDDTQISRYATTGAGSA